MVLLGKLILVVVVVLMVLLGKLIFVVTGKLKWGTTLSNYAVNSGKGWASRSV